MNPGPKRRGGTAVFLRAAVLLAATTLAACQGVLFASLNAEHTPGGVEQRRDLVFDADRELALDVYRPARAEHAPVVVFFYGGDWTHGERGWYRFVGNALAAHGLVAMVPDYRKVPDVAPDGFMADAARAVAWARTHAGEFGGEADDVFVMGHSAGGHIAALLATDPQWLAAVGLQPRDLAGCIGLAGVYLFLPQDSDDDDMLAVFGDDEAVQERAMPLNLVRGAEPPMLLLHGQDDDEVDPANSRLLAEALRAQHEEVELELYPGIDHSTLLFALSPSQHAQAPVLDDVLAFVRAHPRAANATPPAGPPGPSAAAP
ncbi:alpha/beta hydrolase [Dokdonella sp.]|uniref:alpha/beta hydrolase n=1 Tax=Dokdonella sp. TaxID=2291710 RepID=UPI001B162F49|nr:alpha/beta hydrolase [Dokdonella sp.]MBO9661932.1 alpha/beta hydrolase [Dokdonella sp.]